MSDSIAISSQEQQGSPDTLPLKVSTLNLLGDKVMTMTNTLTAAVLVATLAAVSVSAYSQEAIPAPAPEAEASLLHRAMGFGKALPGKAVELKDGLFNNDARLQQAQAQMAVQQEIISQLQTELNTLRIRTAVEHNSMVRNAKSLVTYLESLEVKND
jgi:hypothetical protein